MDAIYRKLYNKYSKLKKEKDSELEKLIHGQDEKFFEYVEAAGDMIDYLKSENERLCEQVSELKNEMASIRLTNNEQYILYQKILVEENQKNKALREEVDRLRNLQQEGLCCQGHDDKVDHNQLKLPGSPLAEPEASNSVSTKMTRKRSRASMHVAEDKIDPCATVEHEHEEENESALGVKRPNIHDFSQNTFQPTCCKRKANASGDTDVGLFNCIFQDLVECVVGMKLSAVSRPEELCVSAFHQSSGYSFRLTWMNNSSGGEAELLYDVISLGTFERVAPEWMREVLIFSSSMCPVFFERVSRVIRLHQ